MSQMMNSGRVCRGMGMRFGNPHMNRGGMTSSMGTILSVSGPPPSLRSFASTRAIFFVRLCTMACILRCAIFSSGPRKPSKRRSMKQKVPRYEPIQRYSHMPLSTGRGALATIMPMLLRLFSQAR